MGRGFRSRTRIGLFLSITIVAMTIVTVPSILVGTGSVAGAAAAHGSPLTFGMVGNNSGPYEYPQEGQAFQAYVANWNAHGGYKGHPIRIINLDGGLDPTQTADAARTLVNSDNVIALADNYAILDCPVNNAFYVTSHIAVLQAIGQSTCYTAGTDFVESKVGGTTRGPNIYVKYLAQLGAKSIGLVEPAIGVPPSILNAEIAGAEAIHVQFHLYPPPAVATAADLDAIIVQMKASGVDAVFGAGEVQQEELLLQEADRQGFGPSNHIPYIFGPTEYDPALASAFKGAYIVPFGEPWTSSQGRSALAVIKRSGVKVAVYDGFAQLGYQSAGEFQQVLDSVKGPVTRATFLAAAERATSVQVPLSPRGFTINLAHPSKDKEGAVVLQDTGSTFKVVTSFIVTDA